MKALFFLPMIVGWMVFGPVAAQAKVCDKQNKWDGHTFVKADAGEKVHFYSSPAPCESKNCAQKRKGYLVRSDFVQVSDEEKGFACVRFRSSKADVFGWIPVKSLEKIKRGPLTRDDLNGDWVQMPCGAGEDCMLTFELEAGAKPEIALMDHVSGHPGGALQVTSIKEEKNQFTVTGTSLNDQPVQLKVIYSGQELPPGTVRVTGDDGWYAGDYHKMK